MAIGFDKVFGVHQHTMVIRNHRAEVLAGNLANADTPGYKARDLDFDVAFKQAANVQMSKPSQMVKTSHCRTRINIYITDINAFNNIIFTICSS